MIDVALPPASVQRTHERLIAPHRRLMAAVIQAVVDDCRRSGRPEMRGVRKASVYMASRDRTWPFSFENLCEELGLNADSLRMELQGSSALPRASNGSPGTAAA